MKKNDDIFDLGYDNSWDQEFEEFDRSVEASFQKEAEEEKEQQKEQEQKKIQEQELVSSFCHFLLELPVDYTMADRVKTYLNSIHFPYVTDVLMDENYLLQIKEVLEQVPLDRKCYKVIWKFYKNYRSEIINRNRDHSRKIHIYLTRKKKEAADQMIKPFCWWKYALILLIPLFLSLDSGRMIPYVTIFEVGLVIFHCGLYRYLRRKMRFAYAWILPMPAIILAIILFLSNVESTIFQQTMTFCLGYIEIGIVMGCYALGVLISSSRKIYGDVLDIHALIENGLKWEKASIIFIIIMIADLFLIPFYSKMPILEFLLGFCFIGFMTSVVAYFNGYFSFLRDVRALKKNGKEALIDQFQGLRPEIGSDITMTRLARFYFIEEGFFVLPYPAIILYDEIKEMRVLPTMQVKDSKRIDFIMKNGRTHKNIIVRSGVEEAIMIGYIKPKTINDDEMSSS